MADQRRTKKPRAPRDEAPHPAEWVIGGISAVLILMLVFYLGYHATTTQGRAPDFVATVGKLGKAGELFHVDVTVTNAGGETAAGVVLQATLEAEGETVETVQIQFDYLPAGSTRRGAFMFRNDPSRADDLRLEVLGYTDP